jgi:peptide/nickel transport system permease protein
MRRILAFFVRRAAAALFALVAMITITFLIFWAIPSEPESFVYPNTQHLSNEQIRYADHLLGIDRPRIVQYGDYLWHLLRFDFGHAWTDATLMPSQKLQEIPIGSLLSDAVPETLSIILGGALLVLLLAVPLGAIAGRRLGSLSDRTISLVALIGICTHPMVVGLILRTAFGNQLHWLPPTGYCKLIPAAQDPCSGPTPWAEHLVLPWVTFALLFLALYTRMIRASVAETLHEDFVRTARAKGAGEVRVLTRHVVPNAGLRVLTMVGMEVGTAIGVCVYIEAAFGFSGLGSMAVRAMFGTVAIDLPLVLAVVTVITTIVVVGNLVVDTLYAAIDPRAEATIRIRRTKELAGGVL